MIYSNLLFQCSLCEKLIDGIPILGEPMARAMMPHVETTSIGQVQEPDTKNTVKYARLRLRRGKKNTEIIWTDQVS